MRLVGIWLRYVGRGLTPVCELAAFDFWDLGVFVGFDSAVVAGDGPWFGEPGPYGG